MAGFGYLLDDGLWILLVFKDLPFQFLIHIASLVTHLDDPL